MTSLGFYPAIAWGGMVTVINQNALEMQRRGHEIAICASNRLNKQAVIAPGSFEGSYEGLRVVYLATHMMGSWSGTVGPTLLGYSGLTYLWREVVTADLVHVHGTRNMVSMMAVLFARLHSKPIILQPHGTLPHIVSSIRIKWLFDKLFMGFLLNNVNVIIALQQSEVEQIIQAGGDQSLIRIVPNGLDCHNYHPEKYLGQFREKFNIPLDQKIILFLGRINKKKGVDILINSFAHLSEDIRKQSVLVIAGPDDGQLMEAKTLVEDHNINKQVLFTGLLEREDVKAAHLDADIFVLPCRTDTFPMAILEACQAGTPMVITETCEIADYLDGVAAKVVPVDSVSVANGIRYLLENQNIYDDYKRGTQKLMISIFSMESVGDKLEQIYQDVNKVKSSQ